MAMNKIRIPHNKGTENAETVRLPLPKSVKIPLAQHMGAPCEPLVKVGDSVKVGQKIGDTDAFMSAPLHSSVSGTVKEIVEYLPANGRPCKAVVIETDGLQTVSEEVKKPVVTDRESFIKAMDTACAYDKRILIEKGLEKPREINCACLGMGADCIASLCEEPVSWEEFLTFDSKYITSAGKGMQSQARKLPAPISDELTAEIQRITREIFAMLDCRGVVRIDYMLDGESNTPYVCEINTIPGSFAFYLFEPMGISFKLLTNRLIELAFAGAKEKKASTFAFDSKILEKASNGIKTVKK